MLLACAVPRTQLSLHAPIGMIKLELVLQCVIGTLKTARAEARGSEELVVRFQQRRCAITDSAVGK